MLRRGLSFCQTLLSRSRKLGSTFLRHFGKVIVADVKIEKLRKIRTAVVHKRLRELWEVWGY
jgi:hypothetical protein